MRCFVSIDIPKEIWKEIRRVQEQLLYFEGKKTDLENLHLTLKFLSEVDDEKIELVREKLREIEFERFETEIEYVGFFDNVKKGKKYCPVWLHLSECEGLQKKIDAALADIFPVEKRFMSHLTIARVKNLKNKKYFLCGLKKVKIPRRRFVVDSFRLKESVLNPEGAVYRDIEVYKLK